MTCAHDVSVNILFSLVFYIVFFSFETLETA